MKTLVNKNNPAIRITAPEIEVHEEERIFLISGGNYCNMDDWILVEEEPTEGIKGNLEEIPSNVSIDEEPEKQTSVYFKKPDYDKQVVKKMSEELAKIITDQIAEPVDLEKEIDSFLSEVGAPFYWCDESEQRDWCSVIARHFYELGLNARKKK